MKGTGACTNQGEVSYAAFSNMLAAAAVAVTHSTWRPVRAYLKEKNEAIFDTESITA